jgi:hypothetical protein
MLSGSYTLASNVGGRADVTVQGGAMYTIVASNKTVR